MLNLLRIPKIQMFISLFAIVIFAIISNFSIEIIVRYLIIFGFTVGLEYAFWKIRSVNPFLPSASFVTATIVFLLSDPSIALYFPLIAVTLAVLQKQFIRPWGNHIFNPAAFGLFVSAYFGNVISWWGTNTGLISTLVIVLACGYVSAIRMRQWKIILPFLLTVFAFVFVRLGIDTAISQFSVGSFLFFAFVMLPEPMTAAKGNWMKPVYGFLAAILPFVFINIPYVSDLQLGSLLLGNLIFKFIERQ